MIRKFLNREEELQFLNKRHDNAQFEFFVIYGRRRIGKTALIKKFIESRPSIYFLCDKAGTAQNIERFKQKVAEFLNEPVIATNDLEEIFSYMIRNAKRKLVIVFDEFSYLVEKDAAIPSIFQRAIDEVLTNENTMLILCGSSISMMEKGVLSHSSPLYGRKTAHIKLSEIPLKHISSFFQSNCLEKNIEFWSILGGVPFYLEKFSDSRSALKNAEEQILSRSGQLYEEIDFLLKEELREPDTYKSILSAIAQGNSKLVEIANKAGIRAQDIDKYLKVLIRLGFVEKENPVIGKQKRTLYSICNNFASFWFMFCEPMKSNLEISDTARAEEILKCQFSAYVGKKFERFIKQVLLRKNDFRKVGRWWGHYRENGERKELEIDVVGVKENEILFGECKWKNNVNAEAMLSDLKDKVQHIDINKKVSYAIFAKSFKNRASAAQCFDLKDISEML